MRVLVEVVVEQDADVGQRASDLLAGLVAIDESYAPVPMSPAEDDVGRVGAGQHVALVRGELLDGLTIENVRSADHVLRAWYDSTVQPFGSD